MRKAIIGEYDTRKTLNVIKAGSRGGSDWCNVFNNVIVLKDNKFEMIAEQGKEKRKNNFLD